MTERQRPIPEYQIESQAGSRILEIEQALREERDLINAMDKMVQEAADKGVAEATAIREWMPKIEEVRRRRAALLERYLDEIKENE